MATKTKFEPEREISDRIIAAIDAGTPPWREPWKGEGGGVAFPGGSTASATAGSTC